MRIPSLSPANRQSLIYRPQFSAHANGNKPIQFYDPNNSGAFNFLCNFYPRPIHLDGKNWPTVEHYFQAQKFIQHPKAAWVAELIRLCPDPNLIKKLANCREFRVFYPNNWHGPRKIDLMRKALMAKFTQHPDLKERLLSTQQRRIEELFDEEWGMGADGKGKNLAGRLLMEIRSKLQEK